QLMGFLRLYNLPSLPKNKRSREQDWNADRYGRVLNQVMQAFGRLYAGTGNHIDIGHIERCKGMI
ncbi:hypothetical protein, partial [Pedobacter agri]|uniref:hypothetical protein n=1 Tax=Pedobacter agri TaxID=454586 RepID=UPI002931F535